MHPQSPPLTIGVNVLKESVDLAILGETFDSKITFEKHHRWFPVQLLKDLVSCGTWRVFYDSSPLRRCFRGSILPVLEDCSAVWFSASDTHLKLLDRVVSGARFLTAWGSV